MEENNNLLQQISNIYIELKKFSEINVLNTIILSGSGILIKEDDKTIEKIYRHSDGKLHELFDNAIPIQCIYKKAKPIFMTPTDEYVNFGIYMWDISSFNKVIKVEAQCYAILSMLKLAEKYKESRPYLSQLFIYYSSLFYEFLVSFMRDEAGLFIDVKNKTKSSDEKISIKPNKSNYKLSDQILVYLSLLYLNKMYNDEIYKKYAKDLNIERYPAELNSILNFISDSIEAILSLPSRQLSQFINTLYECSKLDKESENTEMYREFIALLSDEIINRIKASGEVEKGENNFEPVSFYTNLRCANALFEGYLVTGIDKFLDASNKIIKYISSYYNNDLSLYIHEYDNKISISIRDIAEMIKLFNYQYIINKNFEALNRLNKTYYNVIKPSGIMQNDVLITDEIEDIFDNMKVSTKPPVFLKSFRINSKNSIQIKASKYVNTQYSLYSSYIFLNLEKPAD